MAIATILDTAPSKNPNLAQNFSSLQLEKEADNNNIRSHNNKLSFRKKDECLKNF